MHDIIIDRQRHQARAMSSCPAPIRGDFPISARLIVSKDVHIAVVGIDFEPALLWREPAIDHSAYGEPALPKPERERLLFSSIASVALDADRHSATILLYPAPRMGQ